MRGEPAAPAPVAPPGARVAPAWASGEEPTGSAGGAHPAAPAPLGADLGGGGGGSGGGSDRGDTSDSGSSSSDRGSSTSSKGRSSGDLPVLMGREGRALEIDDQQPEILKKAAGARAGVFYAEVTLPGGPAHQRALTGAAPADPSVEDVLNLEEERVLEYTSLERLLEALALPDWYTDLLEPSFEED